MQPQNSSDSILVLWYVTEKCDFLIRVSFKRRSAGSSMVASVLSMAKTISRPIPSRLWNQFKLIINCTHFCPIIRRVPKKNITVVPSHPSSRTPPRYKGQVLLSRGNVLILSLHLTRVLWTPLTRTEDTFILLRWTDSHKLTSSTWAHLCCAL